MLKAIETVYNGYRFRSRLEARWAVFFDALGLPYEYEREGFDLGDGVRYLPDFWLPTIDAWYEIKPELPKDGPDPKLVRLAQRSRRDVYLCAGDPWRPVTFILIPSEMPTQVPPDFRLLAGSYEVVVFSGGRYPDAPAGSCDGDLYAWQECTECGTLSLGELSTWCHHPHLCQHFKDERITPRLLNAYAAARQARFEHGEAPRLNV
jgi:hypothetical protein